MDARQFHEFQPDPAAANPEPCKAFFLLLHLCAFYIGGELSFDVQLILLANAVPECSLVDDEDSGPRLGWNTWITSREPERDVEDAVFEGEEVRWVNDKG